MSTPDGRLSASAGESPRSSRPRYAPDFATVPYRGPASGPHRNGRPGGPRRSVVMIAVAVAAVVVTVAAVIAYRGGKGPATGFTPTASSPEQDAKQITSAFLQAWRNGNLERAARYTDHPAAARSALSAYRADLHLKKVTGTVVSAADTGTSPAPRASVTFAVDATVSARDTAKTLTGAWSYHSALVTYQRPGSRSWYIAWAPDVLAPNLTASTHLAAVTVPPQVISVTDGGGNDLASYGDAGLSTIANRLSQRTPTGGPGHPGLSVEIQTAAGKTVPDSQAAVISPGNLPELATTISARAETAARSAVAEHKNSSIVAIQPSTGKIIAIANNDGYNDFALTAAVAPGSTGKIISATALLADGVLTANSDVSCPEAYTVQGVTYHNDSNETEPASTPMVDDFAQSCNNAFDQWWRHLTNGRLAAAAQKYYGLNKPWDIGIGQSATYYRTPPGASGSEVAQEAFGEGAISASPLAIASVAATIDAGSFRQPILVPGTRQISGTPLPGGTREGLKQMMRAVVTTGTAAGLGFGRDVYAKTGTADIDGQEQPNSWFVAFDPGKDVAVACLVLDAGYGEEFAAPQVRSFLSRYSRERR